MTSVETIGRIRRAHFVQKLSIREIARRLRMSRKTVRKAIEAPESAFAYEREVQPKPKLGAHVEALEALLAANEKKPRRERLTLMRLYEELKATTDYTGGYDAVRRHARRWQRDEAGRTAVVFVPLAFGPGEAYQFDWSHEQVVIAGVSTRVKVAHMRLCHSRMFFVRAYPRESQEMVFDAHIRGFAFLGGVCTRGIYDNMKTAVETVFVGKDRQFNRRFLQMCSHYLIEPTACTPAAGWEKGQVENQVGNVRERFFTPTLRFKSYDELNAWLADRCMMHARAMMHPEFRDRTVWDVYQDEKPSLMQLPNTPFDGFHALPAAVSKTLLVRFDYNKYSVQARAAGRPVELHAYADRVVIRQDGMVVGEHARRFGRDCIAYDPWHYVPVLAKKPGALRNGAPFRDWSLPPALEQLRARLKGKPDGDRQMVAILSAVLVDGMEAVETAVTEALGLDLPGSEVVLNILARSRAAPTVPAIATPERLKLVIEPQADAARYDRLCRMTRAA
ncbi:MAG: IS21 family transposase [Methylobacterium sp.]|jgi:transposase